MAQAGRTRTSRGLTPAWVAVPLGVLVVILTIAGLVAIASAGQSEGQLTPSTWRGPGLTPSTLRWPNSEVQRGRNGQLAAEICPGSCCNTSCVHMDIHTGKGADGERAKSGNRRAEPHSA